MASTVVLATSVFTGQAFAAGLVVSPGSANIGESVTVSVTGCPDGADALWLTLFQSMGEDEGMLPILVDLNSDDMTMSGGTMTATFTVPSSATAGDGALWVGCYVVADHEDAEIHGVYSTLKLVAASVTPQTTTAPPTPTPTPTVPEVAPVAEPIAAQPHFSG